MPMTVADLIKMLEDYKQDSVVILAKDGEGNGYSPLDVISTGGYEAETTWGGRVVRGEDGYDARSCVVLWPAS